MYTPSELERRSARTGGSILFHWRVRETLATGKSQVEETKEGKEGKLFNSLQTRITELISSCIFASEEWIHGKRVLVEWLARNPLS